MAAEELKCPNCGAPLDFKNIDEPTMRCPYCETVVVVPEELRPAKPIAFEMFSVSTPTVEITQTPAKPLRGGRITLLIIGVVVFIAASIFIPIYISQQAQSAAMTFSSELQKTVLSPVQTQLIEAAVVTPTPKPSLTPTPGFAYPVNSFGEEGIGAGMFNDARYIAVDGQQSVYVADYQGGRVQRFDASGKYQSQWRVGDKNTIILGMTANHEGQVFVAYNNLIARYDGKTGKLLGKMSSPNGGAFGDIYATSDGQLAAVWYEGRFGLITSLEGHREDLVFFDSNGKITHTYPSIISGQTESLALDVYLAVDGSGTIYALSDSVIYQFSPTGKYINNFNNPGDQAGQASAANAIAVDGQGRLYLGSGNQIQVLSKDGRLLDVFPAGKYVDMLAVDEQGHIWAVARDKVLEFALRGK